MSGIFISHSSKDFATCTELRERLRKHGYEAMFLDFDPVDGIPAGHDWERELYRSLKICRAVIFVASEHSLASRWCFAEITQSRAMGKLVFPFRVDTCSTESLLADMQVIDATGNRDEAYQRLFAGLRTAGLDPSDSFGWQRGRSPYPGLNVFDERDAAIYFGREQEVGQLMDTLASMRRLNDTRLGVVVGASGTGKSSLVRAGLLPRLRKDQQHWLVVRPFRPRDNPVAELSRSLAAEFPEEHALRNWKQIREQLCGNGQSVPQSNAHELLLDIIRELAEARQQPDATVLLIIDQFEELIDSESSSRAAAFLEFLCAALQSAGNSLLAMVTIRADFWEAFQKLPQMQTLPLAEFSLKPMQSERLPLVIEGPKRVEDFEFEEGLVGTLVHDTEGGGALPLLAFTLRQLFEGRTDQGRITVDYYENTLGGIEKSISHTIAQCLPDQVFTPALEKDLRSAFRKLARVDDEGRFVRRTTRWDEMREGAKPALEKLCEARLLVEGEDGALEVAHEAIFNAAVWKRLNDWLNDDKEFLLWRRRVTDEAVEWQSSGSSSRFLLTGGRLATAKRFARLYADDIDPLVGQFLAKSVRREHTRRGGVIATVAVVMLVLAGLSAFAFWKKGEADREAQRADAEAVEADKQARLAGEQAARADRERDIATVERLAAQSSQVATTNPQLGLLLAVEALDYMQSAEIYLATAERNLRETLMEDSGLALIRSDPDELAVTDNGYPNDVALSDDGRWIAALWRESGGEAGQEIRGTLRVWDREATEPKVPVAKLEHEPWDRNAWEGKAAFSPNGRWLLSSDGVGCQLWTRENADTSKFNKSASYAQERFLDLSDDWLVTRRDSTGPSGGWQLCVRPLSALGQAPRVLLEQTVAERQSGGDYLQQAFVACNERYVLAERLSNRTSRLFGWKLAVNAPPEPLKLAVPAYPDRNSAKRSDDRHWLFSGSPASGGQLWDLDQDSPAPKPFTVDAAQAGNAAALQYGELFVLAVFADGLVTGSSGGKCQVWSAKDSPEPGTARLQRTIAGSPHSIVTGSGWLCFAGTNDRQQQGLILQPIGGFGSPRSINLQVSVLRTSADGRWMAGATKGSVRVWDLSRGDPIGSFQLPPGLQTNGTQEWAVGIESGPARVSRYNLPAGATAEMETENLPAGHNISAMKSGVPWPWLVTKSASGEFHLWDLRAERIFASSQILPGFLEHDSRIASALDTSPDRRWFVASTDRSEPADFQLWRAGNDGTWTPPINLRLHEQSSEKRRASFATITPGSRWLLTSLFGDGELSLWDLRAEDEAALRQSRVVLQVPAGWPSVSPDGRWLVVRTNDTVHCWDLTSQDLAASLVSVQCHEQGTRTVAFSGNSQWLLTTAGRSDEVGGSEARVWKMSDFGRESSTPPIVLPGRSEVISNAVLSFDGSKAATINDNSTGSGSTRIWRLDSDSPEPPSYLLQELTAVGFGPDDKYLIAHDNQGWNGSLYRMPLALSELRKMAHRMLDRNLSQQEWDEYFRGQAYRKTFADLPIGPNIAPQGIPR